MVVRIMGYCAAVLGIGLTALAGVIALWVLDGRSERTIRDLEQEAEALVDSYLEIIQDNRLLAVREVKRKLAHAYRSALTVNRPQYRDGAWLVDISLVDLTSGSHASYQAELTDVIEGQAPGIVPRPHLGDMRFDRLWRFAEYVDVPTPRVNRLSLRMSFLSRVDAGDIRSEIGRLGLNENGADAGWLAATALLQTAQMRTLETIEIEPHEAPTPPPPLRDDVAGPVEPR